MISIDIKKQLTPTIKSFHLDVKTTVAKGQLIALFGPSGAGKTSVLRILSGLLKPDQGQIIVDGINWFDGEKKRNIPPQKREVGMVFQNTNLFPNMNVLKNLQYALAVKKDTDHVDELIELTEIESLLYRKPDSLSGGERQRAALARALVRKPKMLLLDEPLSALDYNMRKHLQDQILKLHQRFGLTSILVSHDLGEIYRLADHVIMMEDGHITSEGAPSEIFGNKKISGKFQFTGEILGISKQDIVYIVSILVANQIIKVAADPSEIAELNIGDKVLVASKAFNPVIHRIG